jgi:hypothetical protein
MRSHPIDFCARLEGLAAKSVHIAFHYEVLKFAKKSANSELEKYISSRINEINELMLNNAIE